MGTSKKVFWRHEVSDGVYEESGESDGTSASIEEAFIFKLGNVLGGRNEVVKSPVIELLKFMDMTLEKEEAEAEHEKAKMYIQYLANVFSQKQEGKDPQLEKARKEFENMLRPNTRKQVEKKEYEWDFDPSALIE
ncbi:hypothetical protein [Oceanobacillus sojae]|uniref:hypothetical protein n=1 Tax=Oceanobacillus sojae TaxID=582851 RepID=UPI0036D3F03C